MSAISIKEINYIDNFLLEITFNDNKKNVIDFGAFLETHSHPQFNKYKKINNFKKFKIENGNVVWGKDWDMIFPISDLYNGILKLK